MDCKELSDKLKLVMLLHRTAVRSKSGFQCGQYPFVDYVIHHEGCTQNEIAQALHVTPASVAVSLGRMEQAGILCKSKDESNARCNRISVTEKGLEMYNNGKEYVDYLNEKMFESLSKEDIESFDKVLNKIIFNMTGEEAVSPYIFDCFKQKLEGSR